MEYLGYVFDLPSQTKGKWNPVELVFDEQENFLNATSKILKIFKHPDGDGKCIVSDADGQKYLLSVVHATFDTSFNSLKVFPVECHKMTK